MMHSLRLLGAALFLFFVAIPVAVVLALMAIALGVASAVGLGFGVFSLVAWLGFGRPEAARGALFSLGGGAAAFVAAVFLWNALFAARAGWKRRRRGVDFSAGSSGPRPALR